MDGEDSAAKRTRLDSPESPHNTEATTSTRRSKPATSPFKQYTIKFDVEERLPEEYEDLLLLGKFITCTPNGIVAFTWHDDSHQMYLLFLNMHTRCKFSERTLPDRMEVRYLHAIDEKTVVVAGNRFIYEERMARVEPRAFAILFTSDDGFRTVTKTEVTLTLPPSPKARYPDFFVTVGNGFVFAMRDLEEMYRKPMNLFYVPFRELCIVGATDEQTKSIIATPVGSMKATGEERFVPIEYNRTSFAVLMGDARKPRIDVYDIQTRSLSRSIHVAWPLAITFPPQVAHTIPINGKRSALLQIADGAKLRLDLETGTVEEMASFIPSSNARLLLKNHVLGKFTAIERVAFGIQGDEEDDELHDSEDDFNADDSRDSRTPVVDALYLTAGWTSIDDSMMIGWFATDLVDDDSLRPERQIRPGVSERFSEDRFTTAEIMMMRVPVSKVHSLVTLATDAVNRLLSQDIRHEITQDANPKSVPEYIKAIVTFPERTLAIQPSP